MSIRPARLAILSIVLLGALTACTVYPTPRTPALSTTTSAEHCQRIFWREVERAEWTRAQALLAPNVVWRSGNRVLSRDEVVPWLQQLQIKSASVTGVSIKANVNDMTLVYSLQISAARMLIQPQQGGTPKAQAANKRCLQNLHVVAVWQRATPALGARTSPGPYLLTVEDLAPDLAAPGSAPCTG
jgi:hypothetical protein